MRKVLWYDKPAEIWNQALPIGNGRIGAMVYSGAISDRFQINEESLWSGYPNKNTEKLNIEEIEKIRQLVKEKRYKEAYEETNGTMSGLRSDAYVPYGSLFIDIITKRLKNSNVTDYYRELSLEEGIVRTSFKLDGARVEKEAFVSMADDVLVVRIKSEKKIDLHIYQAIDLENSTSATDGVITSQGKCPVNASLFGVVSDDMTETIHFCSRIKTVPCKKEFAFGNGIWLRNVEELTVVFSIKTSFNGFDKMPVSEGKEYINASLDALLKTDDYTYDELKERHIKEHRKYFDRVELEIEGEDFSDLPTDKRLESAASGKVDNGLVCLLFDFGRYLTIASSAFGTQPTNLQGIWNEHLMQHWSCNYTLNINTEMNYWATETVNLPECHMPLFKMLKELSMKGNKFGFRGWNVWHNTDLWRFNHEVTCEAKYAYWPLGGVWMCRHIWEHYLHTRDVNFLKEYYPVMAGAADFLMDWLYENEDGYLTTCPSMSPENLFLYNGEKCAVCEGSAMDMEIIYDFFDKFIKISEILGKETTVYEDVFKKLKPVKIGSDGRILEWGIEVDEFDPGHRHISHLYGYFPAGIFTEEKYVNAVRETLRVRLENGGGSTGWSNAWIANVYARLGEGEKVMHYIRNMFVKSSFNNMLDACPPFQIDGNFGIMSAICEAIVQSHNGKVELLPALPSEWKAGYVKGFVTRTGEKVDFKWRDGKITEKNFYGVN